MAQPFTEKNTYASQRVAGYREPRDCVAIPAQLFHHVFDLLSHPLSSHLNAIVGQRTGIGPTCEYDKLAIVVSILEGAREVIEVLLERVLERSGRRGSLQSYRVAPKPMPKLVTVDFWTCFGSKKELTHVQVRIDDLLSSE